MWNKSCNSPFNVEAKQYCQVGIGKEQPGQLEQTRFSPLRPVMSGKELSPSYSPKLEIVKGQSHQKLDFP
jgi:hypothetical protein